MGILNIRLFAASFLPFTPSADFPPKSSADLEFAMTEQIYVSPQKAVYRGDLSAKPDTEPPVDATVRIVKMAIGPTDIETLRNEARFYTKELADIQGISIPNFYGLFEGEVFGDRAACILLQDAGKPLNRPILQYPMKLRVAMAQLLADVHDRSVQHNDFCQRHILLDEHERPMLIDFDRAESHICELGMEIMANTWEPNFIKFNCEELHDGCKTLELWVPTMITYCGAQHAVKSIKKLEDLTKRAGIMCHPATAMEQAVEVMNDFCAKYGSTFQYLMRQV